MIIEPRRNRDYAASIAYVVDESDLSVNRLETLLAGLIDFTREVMKFDREKDDCVLACVLDLTPRLQTEAATKPARVRAAKKAVGSWS